MIDQPDYVDERMSAQNSFFMVWGRNPVPLEEILHEDEYYMKLSQIKGGTMSSNQKEKAVLFCVGIQGKDKRSILRELDILGVNEKALFPGLDGIGRHIEQKYRFNFNESII